MQAVPLLPICRTNEPAKGAALVRRSVTGHRSSAPLASKSTSRLATRPASNVAHRALGAQSGAATVGAVAERRPLHPDVLRMLVLTLLTLAALYIVTR